MATPAQIKAIHVLKRSAALDDESYRAVLAQVGGAASSRDLTEPAAGRVIERLKVLAGQTGIPRAPAPGGKAHVGKVLSLWREAIDAGVIRNGSDEALRTFVRRQTKGPDAPDGVAAPQFLTPKQATRVIEGLKAMLRRGMS